MMAEMINYQNTMLWHEALQYLNMACYQQTMGKLRLLLAEHPNDAFLLYLMAFCYYALDQYLEASYYCVAALQYGCNPENGHYLLGKIYLMMKKYQEAEQELLKAQQSNPDNGSVAATYGYLIFITGHKRKGEKLLQEALDLDPINDVALHYNYLCNLAKDSRGERLIFIHKSLQVSNKQLQQLIKVGLSKYYRKDYQSADNYFKQAAEIAPTNLGICFYLKEIKRLMNPWIYPLYFIEKVGGSTLWGISSIVMAVVLSIFGQTILALVVIGGYLIYTMYCWLVEFIF